MGRVLTGLEAAAPGVARTRAEGLGPPVDRRLSAAARRPCVGLGPATDEAGRTARAGKVNIVRNLFYFFL